MKGRNPWSRGPDGSRTRARRVTVKARIVKLNPQRGAARGRSFVSAKAVDAHLRYLERDGVTRDGERGQVYSATEDAADGRDFLDRGREDRHQFRFIVSAKEGVDLSDLRQTTRDLMAQMETDLQTRLDWIAVDHYNTGHPHTHILVRGVTDQGKILNIAGDYIAHGIRERASEIVTLELGRQTELEVTDQLRREVEADRFTRLDRMLIAEQEAANEFADLRPDHDTLETMKRNRALLIARARRLEKMGLATEVRPGEWHISDRAEGTLRALGEREDIIKSMHRALEGNDLNDARGIAQLAVHRDKLRERITGRVLARDLAGDGNGDRVQLVIDGTDGRVHQIELRADRCDGIGRGMIVAAAPPPTEPRAADRNIFAATGSDGTYHPSRHIEIARAEKITPDPERFVAAHVRRLEALRRAGIVERWSEDHWKVPQDLPERGLAHDRKGHGPGARLEMLSPIGLDKQVTHDGATWLDKELMRQGSPALRETGFGLEMKTGHRTPQAGPRPTRRRARPRPRPHPRPARPRPETGSPRDRPRRPRHGSGAWPRLDPRQTRQPLRWRTDRQHTTPQRPLRHDRQRHGLQPRPLERRAGTTARPADRRRRDVRRRCGLGVRPEAGAGVVRWPWRVRVARTIFYTKGGKCEFAASANQECAIGRSGHSDERGPGFIAAARKATPSPRADLRVSRSILVCPHRVVRCKC